MSYYGQGDYYGRGGLLDAVGGLLKKGVQAAAGFVTGGPLGAVSAILPRSGISSPTFSGGGGPVLPTVNPPFGGLPGAGVGMGGVRIGIGEPTGNLGAYLTRAGTPRRIRKDGRPYKRPTMDPGNSRALRRASRRIDRFLGVARGALKHTNYKVVSKSAGKGKRKR